MPREVSFFGASREERRGSEHANLFAIDDERRELALFHDAAPRWIHASQSTPPQVALELVPGADPVLSGDMRRWSGALALVAMVLVVAVARAGEEPEVVREAKLAALVDRIERRHEKHDTFVARFTQLVKVRAHDKALERHGEVAFKRPGKVSFRYDDGDWAVSDGERLRAYVAADKRVYDMEAKRSLYPAALAFLRTKGKLADLFRLRRIETGDLRAGGGAVLEAVPKAASPSFAKMLLFVDETGQVLRILIVDGQGNTNRFLFEQAVVGKPIAEAKFRAPKTPKGATVVRP
jgi:outer membrane lipoprotein carrier protein